MHKQKGASFLSWVVGIGIAILFFITLVKLAPLYMEHYAVRTMVDDIAAMPEMQKVNTRQVRHKVNDFLNINGMYTLTSDAFAIKPVEGKNGVRALEVYYEVRKPWLGNIDFLTTFKYSKELGKAGDS